MFVFHIKKKGLWCSREVHGGYDKRLAWKVGLNGIIVIWEVVLWHSLVCWQHRE